MTGKMGARTSRLLYRVRRLKRASCIYQRIKKIKLTTPAVLFRVAAIVAHSSNIMNNQTPGCCCMCTNMRMACRSVMRSP
jgi:hypothetical protein